MLTPYILRHQSHEFYCQLFINFRKNDHLTMFTQKFLVRKLFLVFWLKIIFDSNYPPYSYTFIIKGGSKK